MPVLNRAAELQDEIAAWRRQIHQHPETMFAVEKTAAFVADKLKEFGVDEVVTGIGRTGVVGLIKGHGSADGSVRTIGLRADMDALPITETSGKPWASTVPGKMHACGHDGHTAMLLGAAKYLAETRNFAGNVAVIFQPAEEGGGGGREMVKDGMMERFAIAEVYGMHNMPGMPVGQFGTRTGAIMAATDEFDIVINGRGGHAAQPHRTVDTIVIGAQIVSALQTITSRNTDPIASLVVSVTKFNAGFAYNVIPGQATLSGTVRTLSGTVRDEAEERIRQLCAGFGAANGADITVRYQRNYPVVVNHATETGHAVSVAADIAGSGGVNATIDPMMGGEDFAYMLEARPGAFVFMGNGDTAGLHHPAYDFNDDAIPHGVSYWVKLAEARLPA